MLELVTKRPSLAFLLDGKSAELPVTLDIAEYRGLYESTAAARDGRGDDLGALEWFAGFARRYLGDAVDALSADGLVELMQAWFAARQEQGQPGEGEPSASRA